MDPKTARQLDRLLADGELSRPEAEAIFDRVYAAVAPEPRSRQLPRAALWATGAVATAALVLLAIRPAAVDPHAGLTARGSATAPLALELRCSDGTLAACPLTSSLVFLVSGNAAAGFLSAYAEPLEGAGERVWYFSREAHSPALTAPLDGTHVFDRAATLSGSHQPGRYRVHAFFSDQPLGRDELLPQAPSSGVHAQLHVDVTLIEED